MLSNHHLIVLDEPTPLPYMGFGQPIQEPILITTTPTRTITDIQLDHIAFTKLGVYNSIEEALRKRHSKKCCERDNDEDGNCDIHRVRRG
jgi:hypothetical protein